MGIVEEDIARVRASTDFVALVSEQLGLRRVGTRWVGLCPFHSEKSPSFSVNAELGMYYCFGCGAKGDAITFLRETEHLDFVEAVERLAGRAGISLRYDDEAGGQDRQRRKRIHDTLEAAVAWYHERLRTSDDAKAARAYLRRERGYDAEVVEQYRLGWAPEGWNQLVRGLGVPASALVDAGLATVDEKGRHTDFFRGRLLFPIFDPSDHAVGAGGRLMPGGRGPKYKNTSNTAVYDKSRTLYGLNWAKKAIIERNQVVVCEGYTDVIGLHRSGVGEAVATCGTALADGHIRLLTGFARRILLAYDSDNAGQSAADKFYEWEKRYDVEIRVIDLPAGSDPADLARENPAALASAVSDARPYLGFRLDRLFGRSDLSTPEGRARTAEAAVAMVAEHPVELVRDQYLMQVADRCRVDVERLRSMATGTPRSDSPVRVSGSARVEAEAPATVVGGPEREALKLAVHRRAEVIDRLDRPLFSNALAGVTFELLRDTDDVHEAISRADPQTADLLQRVAVEISEADPDDVAMRLVERAVQRELTELQAEMRQAPDDQHAAYAPTISWLKLALERMRADDANLRASALEAERSLIDWLAQRHAVAAAPVAGAAEVVG